MGCLAVFLLVVFLSVPVALLVYWNKASVQHPSLEAPVSASVANGHDSTFCVYKGHDVHFILHYPGDLNTSNSGSSNQRNGTWNNDGVLSFPNKRTVTYYRHSSDPNTLRLNGKVFRLDEGRVFSINEDAKVQQLSIPPMRVRDQQSLNEFSRLVRNSLSRGLRL